MRIMMRTSDGAVRYVESLRSRSEALEWLRRAAEDCLASGHRRVELNVEDLYLVTSYSGDDCTITYAEDDDA
jgi:hypothetical protein